MPAWGFLVTTTRMSLLEAMLPCLSAFRYICVSSFRLPRSRSNHLHIFMPHRHHQTLTPSLPSASLILPILPNCNRRRVYETHPIFIVSFSISSLSNTAKNLLNNHPNNNHPPAQSTRHSRTLFYNGAEYKTWHGSPEKHVEKT